MLFVFGVFYFIEVPHGDETSKINFDVKEVVKKQSSGDLDRRDSVNLPLVINKRIKDDKPEVHALLEKIPNGSPLKYTRMTSSYGYRVHPISKKRKFHSGIDLRAKVGSEVYATASGIVLCAGKTKQRKAGVVVIIKHDFGFSTHYLHLSQVLVNKGDKIQVGDLLALSGNSGSSSGPHLHYSIKKYGRSVNPIVYLRWGERNMKEMFIHIGSMGYVSWNDIKEYRPFINLIMLTEKIANLNSVEKNKKV